MTRTTLSYAAGLSSKQRFMRRGENSQILGAQSQDSRVLRRILGRLGLCVGAPEIFLTVQGRRRFLSRSGVKDVGNV